MKDIDLILDNCLEQMRRGEPADACGSAIGQLQALLETAARVNAASDYTPNSVRRAAALQRFNQARAEIVRQRAYTGPGTKHRSGWLALAGGLAALAIAFASYQSFQPREAPVTMVNADARGNMVFLLSDEENAIAEFTSFRLAVEQVGLLKNDGTAWIGFAPEIAEVDLTLVKGSLSQAIWRGNVPPGNYRQVFVLISGAEGVLAANGEIIRLAGSRIVIDYPFEVIEGGLTSFTYDLAVTPESAGKGYSLEPQAEQSGARHQYQGEGPSPGPGGSDNTGQEHQGEAAGDVEISNVPVPPKEDSTGLTGGPQYHGSGTITPVPNQSSGGLNGISPTPNQDENKPGTTGSNSPGHNEVEAPRQGTDTTGTGPGRTNPPEEGQHLEPGSTQAGPGDGAEDSDGGPGPGEPGETRPVPPEDGQGTTPPGGNGAGSGGGTATKAPGNGR
jgi:hypothetical protein